MVATQHEEMKAGRQPPWGPTQDSSAGSGPAPCLPPSSPPAAQRTPEIAPAAPPPSPGEKATLLPDPLDLLLMDDLNRLLPGLETGTREKRLSLMSLGELPSPASLADVDMPSADELARITRDLPLGCF